MKHLLIALLLIPSLSFANCKTEETAEEAVETLEIKTDVPKHLVGAKITITLADGTVSTVPAERFKVVKRQQQFIVTKTKQNRVVSCENASAEQKKNIVSGLVGYGNDGGLERTQDPTRVNVETKIGPSLGIQYQRKFEKVILGGQGQTNGTGSVLIGLEF